mgnify:CR=1 FL=1
MDIKGTLQSWGSTMYSAGSSAGASLKGYAESGVEKGKLGYNKTVSLIQDNPKAAIITGLALAAVAVTTAYLSMSASSVPVDNTTGNVV